MPGAGPPAADSGGASCPEAATRFSRLEPAAASKAASLAAGLRRLSSAAGWSRSETPAAAVSPGKPAWCCPCFGRDKTGASYREDSEPAEK